MALYAEAIIAAEYPAIICHPVQNYIRNKKTGGRQICQIRRHAGLIY